MQAPSIELNIPRNRTFIHLHNPRSAGWMFWDILKSNFKETLKSDYPSPSYNYFNQEAILWMLRQYRFNCYTSHNYRLSSIPNVDNHEFIVISFIREPAKKFLSCYFYTRGITPTSETHPSKKLLLTEFLSQFVNDSDFNKLTLDMSQEEFILGDLDPLKYNDLMNPSFGKFHLFPTERFDDAMICLEKLYPAYFKDCSYAERSNQSMRDQEVTEKDLELVERIPWMGKDRELHSFSFSYLDGILKELFGSMEIIEEARQNFKDRCKQKKGAENATEFGGKRKLNFKGRIITSARILLFGR